MAYSERQDLPTRVGVRKDLIRLFFPVAITVISGSLLTFVERLLLARYSIEGMEAALTVMYFARQFYLPCMAVPLMAQAAVNFHMGAEEKRAIGPCIWQMIWFCVFAAFLTIPLGWGVGQFYFSGTNIGKLALPYYHLLIPLNLLYPLITAFAAFYMGIGRSRFFLASTIGFHLLHLGLCYLLVFGWPGWIPAQGIVGAGRATLISECGLCLLLLFSFLRTSYKIEFGTNLWRFNRTLLWKYATLGLARFGVRVLSTSSWATLIYFVTRKGEDFLLVLSVGGTIAIFTSFLGEALGQAVTMIASRFLGSGQYHKLHYLYKSSLSLLALFGVLFAVPALVFPEATMSLLLSPEKCAQVGEMVAPILWGNWVLFLVFTYNSIPIGFVYAHQQIHYILLLAGLTWIESLTIYVIIQLFHGPAMYFWSFVAFALFFWETAMLYRKMRSLNDSMLPTPAMG